MGRRGGRGLAGPFSPSTTEKPLNFVDVRLTQAEAKAKAIEHLAAAGADASAYEVVTYYQNQPDAMAIRYILERDSVAVVNRLYQEDLLASLWVTRFFRYGEKEEYRVAVHPQDGSLYSINHLLAEEAEGADLEETQAREIAVEHLRSFGLDPERLELKEASSEKLPNRRDHRFVFEAAEGDGRNVDELRYRVRVNVAGDEPVSIYRFLKVPEDWQRERQESHHAQNRAFRPAHRLDCRRGAARPVAARAPRAERGPSLGTAGQNFRSWGGLLITRLSQWPVGCRTRL